MWAVWFMWDQCLNYFIWIFYFPAESWPLVMWNTCISRVSSEWMAEFLYNLIFPLIYMPFLLWLLFVFHFQPSYWPWFINIAFFMYSDDETENFIIFWLTGQISMEFLICFGFKRSTFLHIHFKFLLLFNIVMAQD